MSRTEDEYDDPRSWTKVVGRDRAKPAPLGKLIPEQAQGVSKSTPTGPERKERCQRA